uniref:Putative ovule protein n=1 Tax=Solanum chacoense TaxID=4108 RepID=A0A0V0HH20_SOLCH
MKFKWNEKINVIQLRQYNSSSSNLSIFALLNKLITYDSSRSSSNSNDPYQFCSTMVAPVGSPFSY